MTTYSSVTVVETVYYQRGAEPGLIAEARFSRMVVTDEQPYCRRFCADEEWRPLDLGWLADPGLLVLENREGRFQANPSAEERAEVESRVLELAVGGVPFLAVRPGETARFEPVAAAGLQVRCRRGRAQAYLVVLPR